MIFLMLENAITSKNISMKNCSKKIKINHELLEDINDYLKSIGYLNYLSLSSRLDVMGVTSISSAYS